VIYNKESQIIASNDFILILSTLFLTRLHIYIVLFPVRNVFKV